MKQVGIQFAGIFINKSPRNLFFFPIKVKCASRDI